MKFLSTSLFSLLLISNAFAGNAGKEVLQQYTKTANLLKIHSVTSTTYNGVYKSYKSTGVDVETGLDCELETNAAMRGKDDGSISYKLSTKNDNHTIYATRESSNSIELGRDDTITRKTSHKETKDSLIIESTYRRTEYPLELLGLIPTFTESSKSHVAFLKNGSQIQVQMIEDEIPVKTCNFEAR